MLAIIALVLFILALFLKTIGELDLVTLGFVFLAAHFVFSEYLPWPKRRV
jgi:hypothetical protein